MSGMFSIGDTVVIRRTPLRADSGEAGEVIGLDPTSPWPLSVRLFSGMETIAAPREVRVVRRAPWCAR